jgi:hypothetical protein
VCLLQFIFGLKTRLAVASPVPSRNIAAMAESGSPPAPILMKDAGARVLSPVSHRIESTPSEPGKVRKWFVSGSV